MNILFISLSLGNLKTVSSRSIYTDLLRRFIAQGDHVYVLSPSSKETEAEKAVIEEPGCTIIRFFSGDITHTSTIRKGINTLLIEYRFLRVCKKYLNKVKIDLILYPTPPITIVKAVAYIKKRDGAKAYLMLKDIFPQNAVDLGMMTKKGLKGLLYRFFRAKEKEFYAVSDRIGCMSPANMEYVISHNPQIKPEAVEVCPNALDVADMRLSNEKRLEIREKYGIPQDKTVFAYGGNLGRPQGIPFLIECLKAEKENENAFFLVVGAGTEYGKLQRFVNEEKPKNMKLMEHLPREEYGQLIASCDVGLIFLDHRFTIPNFPSRLLDYMQAGLPVLAATDPNTDLGRIAVDGGFGFRCESDSAEKFVRCVENAMSADLTEMGRKSFEYLNKEYSINNAYGKIMDFMK